GIDYTILRPNLLMQNFINLAGDSIRRSGKFHLPAGNSRISFVDGRDVASAARIVLCSPGKFNNRICTLTGNESLDHYKIAQILSNAVNRQITYMPVSHNDAKRGLLSKGWNSDVVELMVGLYEIARNGWCEEVRTDLKEILEKDPISFEIFARDFRNNWI
ncbi:MAG: hypothetical protein Q4F84_08145, partial [Fibrobacter sp.]|nr:hypothetical protein [Fibrobacter sp.]